MRLRLLLVSAMVLVSTCALLAQTNASGLAFGQAYGTAGFRSQDPAGTMADSSNVVLVFTAADGHRNLVLTQQTGDYIALLEPGRYCIAAYTRSGESLRLGQDQLKCIAVERGKDVRLDVMLVRNSK
jgi:hypothetical protein